MNYKKHIREVPDFPKKGILFYDITTLLADNNAFTAMINEMSAKAKKLGATKIAGIESRGFIFGAPLALALNVPFIPIRKPGKLPYKKVKMEYELEYGKDVIEIHEDAVMPGDNILLVDDLLATGGTINAGAELIKKCGGKVAGMMFAVELNFLNARKKLTGYKIESIVRYD